MEFSFFESACKEGVSAENIECESRMVKKKSGCGMDENGLDFLYEDFARVKIYYNDQDN